MTWEQLGEIAAVGTALLWTLSTLAWTSAGRHVGALPVCFLRLVIACVPLACYGQAVYGHWLPTEAGSHAWLLLGISGLFGFFLADLCLFKAYLLIGPRSGAAAAIAHAAGHGADFLALLPRSTRLAAVAGDGRHAQRRGVGGAGAAGPGCGDATRQAHGAGNLPGGGRGGRGGGGVRALETGAGRWRPHGRHLHPHPRRDGRLRGVRHALWAPGTPSPRPAATPG